MNKNFGEKLREIRLKNNLTMKQVAKKTKLSASYICRIEQGARNPTIKTLDKLFKAYKMNFIDLIIQVYSGKEI